MSQTPTTAMVVIASEQLWPNIHGLVHWHEHEGGLSDLLVYHTSDARFSSGPAQRLERLCRKRYPRVKVRLHEGGFEPQAVYETIHAWKEEFSTSRLVLNATGGIKLMFLGMTDHLDEKTRVVYRERTGHWFELSRESGRTVTVPLDIPMDLTDHLPVGDLVETQWDGPAGSNWMCSNPVDVDVADVVKSLVDTGWNWQAAFSNLGIDEQDGFLFERLVAAAMLAMGVRNLQVNLQLCSPDGQLLQEIDAAANYGGRLLMVDCKLRMDDSSDGITSQIRQADVTRRRLGGLAAKLVLVRPNRLLSESERRLSAASGLHVIDAKDARRFFTALSQFIGIDLPNPLQLAEELLREAPGAPFVRGVLPQRSPRLAGASVHDLDHLLKSERERNGRQWIAYRYQSQLRLLIANIDNRHVTKVESALRKRFSGIPGLQLTVQLSHSGNSANCRITASRTSRTRLLRRLDELESEASLL